MISTADAAEKEAIPIVVREWIALLKVAEPTGITLEGTDEMVPVTPTTMTLQVTGRSPIKTLLIRWGVVVELVIWVRKVAGPTPNSITCAPRWTGSGKVGTKDAGHVAPNGATPLAPPYPGPEGLGVA
jgi:hypothetical protein